MNYSYKQQGHMGRGNIRVKRHLWVSTRTRDQKNIQQEWSFTSKCSRPNELLMCSLAIESVKQQLTIPNNPLLIDLRR